MSARSTAKDMNAAIQLAASMIPGATIELRPAVECPTIALPIPGLSVRFKTDELPTMQLWREGRARAWAFVPTVTRNVEAGARRIVRELDQLVREARNEGPMQRERSGERKLTKHVGLWVSPDDIREASETAKARGMTVAGLLRLGLRMAIEDHPSAVCDDEYALRGALRLLVASKRGIYPDNFAAIAESGSTEDVLIALRVAFRMLAEGRAAARVLGLDWITEDPDACEG